jgi:hypothetical protein
MAEIFDDRSGCDVIKVQVFGVQAEAVCAMAGDAIARQYLQLSHFGGAQSGEDGKLI